MIFVKNATVEKKTSCLAKTVTENTASSFQELQSKKCGQVYSSVGA